MFKLIIFSVVSLGVVLLSWESLHKRRSHGFYRFFAFESILGLFLINIDYWFHEPFSAFQVVSWLLLLLSLVMVVPGFYLLRTAGRPKSGIENTTVLISRGVYKYIRHPLYSSLLFLAWGIFFKNLSFLSGGLVFVAAVFLVATAIAEESENIYEFGADYTAYMKTTKRFIPFVF